MTAIHDKMGVKVRSTNRLDGENAKTRFGASVAERQASASGLKHDDGDLNT